jgi:hypothetical protein
MNVNLIDDFEGAKAPLYHRYPREVNPQPAYMYFNPETGDVGFEYSQEVGSPAAMPMVVWNSLILRWEVPNNLSPRGIRELFDEMKDDLSVIGDGFSDGYDDRMNRVGVYSKEAKDAMQAINERLWNLFPEDYDRTDVWDAADWISAAFYDVVREYREAEDKKVYLDNLVKEAESDGVVLEGIDRVREILDEYVE